MQVSEANFIDLVNYLIKEINLLNGLWRYFANIKLINEPLKRCRLEGGGFNDLYIF